MGSHARLAAEVADIFRRWRDGKFRDDSKFVFCSPSPCFRGGGSFRSGMQSPTGAKRRFAGRIPKRRLGTTGGAALGNDKGGEVWG